MTRAATLVCLLAGTRSASAVLHRRLNLKSTSLPGMQNGLPEEFNKSRLMLMSRLNNANIPEGSFDCTTYAPFCNSSLPFKCDQWTASDTAEIEMNGISKKLQAPNLRSWCMPGLEHYLPYVQKCLIDRTVHAAAKSLQDTQFRNYNDEIDASYCFLEGHCTNEAVTIDTTASEAENMCDVRYQKKAWTMNFNQALKKVFNNATIQATLMTREKGILTQRVARYMTKLACAQGTFQCDVMYCKSTYCRDDYYVSKYSKYLPSVRGNKLKDWDELPKGADLAY